jgi:hypothetical protein
LRDPIEVLIAVIQCEVLGLCGKKEGTKNTVQRPKASPLVQIPAWFVINT